MNSVPVVGHVKSGIHLLCGDKKGAAEAYDTATRSTSKNHDEMNTVTLSTAVAGAGIIGGLIGGPVGAVAGGTSAGFVYDTTRTVMEDKPQGILATANNLVEDPRGGELVYIAGFLQSDKRERFTYTVGLKKLPLSPPHTFP